MSVKSVRFLFSFHFLVYISLFLGGSGNNKMVCVCATCFVGTNHAAISHTGEKRFAISDQDRIFSSSKKSKLQAVAGSMAVVPTANLDADDPWEEDYTEEEPKPPNSAVNSDSDDDSDEEDEEALLAELAKIKRERAEEAIQAAAEKKAAEETIRMENILKGNPLMNNNSSTGTLSSTLLN